MVLKLLARRRLWKTVKHLLYEARHARNMREDVLEAPVLEELEGATHALASTWKEKSGEAEVDRAMERVHKALDPVYPPGSRSRWTELVEVIAVALVVAMALRTYFVQPFKIPTGSMQPTLNGITYEPKPEPHWSDRMPVRLVKFLALGQKYQQFTSLHSGTIRRMMQFSDGKVHLDIDGRTQTLPANLFLHVGEGDYVMRGDLLGSGIEKAGDHIFVDKIRYNFMKPSRGDVFVFNTEGIAHPDIKQNSFYIKRLAAVPGDEVSIDPPYLVVNQTPLLEPEAFRRVAEATDQGYRGYFLARNQPDRPEVLHRPSDILQCGPGEYLPLGDNSAHSLDGRYFGPVNQSQILGPAFLVYWPFTDHWGLVN